MLKIGKLLAVAFSAMFLCLVPVHAAAAGGLELTGYEELSGVDKEGADLAFSKLPESVTGLYAEIGHGVTFQDDVIVYAGQPDPNLAGVYWDGLQKITVRTGTPRLVHDIVLH